MAAPDHLHRRFSLPGATSDVYDLIKLVDTPSYEVKKRGRNNCVGCASDLLSNSSGANNKKTET